MFRSADRTAAVRHLASLAAFCVLMGAAPHAPAQLQAVKPFADYTTALSKRLGITSAHAWGGGLQLQYALSDLLSLCLTGGYSYYEIEQPDAIEQWNWKFWVDRYRGIVASNLASDPALSATLTPEQVLEATPLSVELAVTVPLVEGLAVSGSAGGGIFFFTRKLYIHEEWRKRFEAANYDFQYDYLNFANPKPGSPWYLAGQAELRYALSKDFEATIGGTFAQIVRTKGRRGYDHMAFRSAAGVRLGLNILY
jgi:hypothetical protein